MDVIYLITKASLCKLPFDSDGDAHQITLYSDLVVLYSKWANELIVWFFFSTPSVHYTTFPRHGVVDSDAGDCRQKLIYLCRPAHSTSLV